LAVCELCHKDVMPMLHEKLIEKSAASQGLGEVRGLKKHPMNFVLGRKGSSKEKEMLLAKKGKDKQEQKGQTFMGAEPYQKDHVTLSSPPFSNEPMCFQKSRKLCRGKMFFSTERVGWVAGGGCLVIWGVVRI